MKTDESLYKQLHEKEPTRYDILEYGWALKALADGVTERTVWDMLRHVTQAERYLAEFRGKMVPTPDLNEAEANVAVNLHTYMRKCMDCPLGTVLYRLIAENKGLPVWYAFVKAIAKDSSPKWAYRNAMQAAEGMYRTGNENTDNLLMLSALKMWEDDFANALEWMKG